MDLALYAEGLGFYTAGRSRFGPGGDFYTASHVHPLFAATIARHLEGVRRSLGSARPFSIVELGPGDGALAEGIVRSLAGAATSGGPIEYVLVDRSEPLGLRARDRVERAGRAAGIRVRSRPDAGGEGPFSGAVLANELLDAQPARRLRWTGAGWAELGVRWDGSRLVAAESRTVRPVGGGPLPPGETDGLVVEVSPSAEAFVREVADHLVRGVLLILDYGMEESELRRAHPAGTLAAVRSHRTVSDPLDRPGETDLSTFVNFTRVRAAARSAGWTEVAFDRQAEALGRWGYPELLSEAIRRTRSPEEEVRLRLGSKNLLFGFDRFRALELVPASAGPPRDGVTHEGRGAGR